MLILLYLNKILKAGLLLVTEYFYTVVLLLLLMWKIWALLLPLPFKMTVYQHKYLDRHKYLSNPAHWQPCSFNMAEGVHIHCRNNNNCNSNFFHSARGQWYSRAAIPTQFENTVSFQIQCAGVLRQKQQKCVNFQIVVLHIGSRHRVSQPKWLSCRWLCSWLRAETADNGGWQRVKAQGDKQRASEGENLVAKGTLIKTLCVFVNPGIWDLKLVDWINIFSLPQATVLYLTFWKFIWVNLAAEATDSEAVNNTSPAPLKHSHIPEDKENANPFVKAILHSYSSSDCCALKPLYRCLQLYIA